MRQISLAAALLALGTATLSAQNINKFVISDEAAKKTLIKNEISVETARETTGEQFRLVQDISPRSRKVSAKTTVCAHGA